MILVIVKDANELAFTTINPPSARETNALFWKVQHFAADIHINKLPAVLSIFRGGGKTVEI